MKTPTLFILLLGLVVSLQPNAVAQRRDVNYDEDKVPDFDLPDPLSLEDGTRVEDADTWFKQRRPELLELFRKEVYGRPLIDRPEVRFKLTDSSDEALDGTARRRQITLYLSDDDEGPQLHLLVFLPKKSDGPVPAFLGLNFQGNHTIHADASISLPRGWVRNNASIGVTENKAVEKSRGSTASRWPVEYITSEGYGLVTTYYGDIDPDFDDGFKNGVHSLAPERDQKVASPDDWGSIAGWAWGLSCILDYLQQDDEIAGDQVALMGHSRLGKTSLWAGAEDQRFAIVISNNSGCGGAALHRREFGETVKIINNVFPHWFCDNFVKYGDRVNDCPVDQHQLVSLIAPRPVYIASAQEDRWADPRGEFLSALYADPVYRLLGTEGISQQDMPDVEQPLHSVVGYHIRKGKHDVTLYDWQQWIAFANKHLNQ